MIQRMRQGRVSHLLEITAPSLVTVSNRADGARSV